MPNIRKYKGIKPKRAKRWIFLVKIAVAVYLLLDTLIESQACLMLGVVRTSHSLLFSLYVAFFVTLRNKFMSFMGLCRYISNQVSWFVKMKLATKRERRIVFDLCNSSLYVS